MLAVQSILGALCFIFIGFLFSENKRKVEWKLILTAFVLLNLTFFALTYIPFIQMGLKYLSEGFLKIVSYADGGTQFLFGSLDDRSKFGFVFAFTVVPAIIFFSAIVSILYFYGVIQFIIRLFSRFLSKFLRITGLESLIIIADMFLGMNEGPLFIAKYIPKLTRSQLALSFTAGLSCLAGSTLVMYLTFLGGGDPQKELQFTLFLLTATFMNGFSAIIFAKLFFPETETPFDVKDIEKNESKNKGNLISSTVDGSMTGLKIGVSICAILIAFIPLIHMLNGFLGYIGDVLHINSSIAKSGVFDGLSLEYILGMIFRVFAWLIGIPWNETLQDGSLLGQKVAINELVAYVSLGKLIAAHKISAHATFVSTFALASFSNFTSVGISLGVFSTLDKTRQTEISGFCFKALIAAVLAGFMTASVAAFWSGLLG